MRANSQNDAAGRVVLITGGSSGIGAAVARLYARAGAHVVVTSPETDALNELAQQLSAEGCKVLALTTDVTNDSDVCELISSVLTSFGKIDTLVNCAGIGQLGWINELSPKDVMRIMDVNFFGMLRCTMGVLPTMREAGNGQIVNFASGAAFYGTPGMAAYSASKAAILIFSQALHAELKNSGISVFVVYPDKTSTNFEANTQLVGDFVRRDNKGMSPESVARAVIRGIRKGRRNIYVGKTRTLSFIAAVFPGLTEKKLSRLAMSWTRQAS